MIQIKAPGSARSRINEGRGAAFSRCCSNERDEK